MPSLKRHSSSLRNDARIVSQIKPSEALERDPLIIASGTGVLFDVFEPASAPQVIATIPEFVWELSLGIYLIVKGFKPSPITSTNAQPPWGRGDDLDPCLRKAPLVTADRARLGKDWNATPLRRGVSRFFAPTCAREQQSGDLARRVLGHAGDHV
jgi:hypothetical protein